MSVLEWANLISNYGLALIGLIVIVRWLGPKLDRMFDLIFDLRESNKPHEKVEDIVVMNNCVKSVLQDMMADFRADWCHLWQFHNGIKSLGSHGMPFLYITITHEVKKTGLPTIVPAFEHVPLSMFDEFAMKLMTGDILEYNDHEKDEDKMSELVYEYGVKTIMIRAIRDEDGNVVAFISTAWSKTTGISVQDKINFRSFAQRMSATLARLPDEILVKC